MTQLAAQGVTVRRGGRALLDGIGLSAGAGECIALIGPNGAGKSTLLAVLAGLLKPDSGVVSLDGRALPDWPGTALARRRSYLPQQLRCEWPLPVERLVALGLTPVLPAFGGLSRPDEARVEQVLAAFDLLDLRAQPATTLSGGELARAMLARALVSDPDVLIVDEPITGLDPRHALECVQRLRQLADSGRLVIAALHDLTLAARHATRLVTLHAGRVDADGPPQEVLTRERLLSVFGVEARVADSAGGRYIDFVAPALPPH
jgi:iron complex transport system ATP-binding protein